MKIILSIFCFLLLVPSSYAEVQPSVVLQFKYAPWGFVDGDEEDFNWFSSSDDGSYYKYDMDFERSMGARIIAAPFYVAVNRSTTNIDEEIPDAIVDTISAGLGGAVLDINDYNTYLLGAVGVGKGRFKFKNPSQNDWEIFFDANAEIGFHFEESLLLGLGVDWQLFGEPGETKANYWNLYIATGFAF